MKNLKNNSYWFLAICYLASGLLLVIGLLIYNSMLNEKSPIVSNFYFLLWIFGGSFALMTPLVLKGMFSDTLLTTQKEIDDLKIELWIKESQLRQKELQLKLVEKFLREKVQE